MAQQSFEEFVKEWFRDFRIPIEVTVLMLVAVLAGWLTVYQYSEGVVSLCARGPSCYSVSRADSPGEFLVWLGLYAIVFVVLVLRLVWVLFRSKSATHP